MPSHAALTRVETGALTCTAGLGVHVIMKIHFVEREGMKFETNRLHLSRQDELVMWAALKMASEKSKLSAKTARFWASVL